MIRNKLNECIDKRKVIMVGAIVVTVRLYHTRQALNQNLDEKVCRKLKAI